MFVPGIDSLFNILHNNISKNRNVFVKAQYSTEGILHPTFGIGFLNTGEQEESILNGQFGIDDMKFLHNNNYLLVPIGINIKYATFYINPEIGIGYNFSNKTIQVTKFSNGKHERKTGN